VSVFLDTNVLIYSISSDSTESAKRERADEILRRDDCVISVQVLQEFYAQMTRASRPGALSHQTVLNLIQGWQRFPIQENTFAVLTRALDIVERYRFSIWDSLIIAAALLGECETLFSEDLSHGQRIENLTIVNPFLSSRIVHL